MEAGIKIPPYISRGYKRNLYLIAVSNSLLAEMSDIDEARFIYDDMREFLSYHQGKVNGGNVFYREMETKTPKVLKYLMNHKRDIDGVLFSILLLKKIKEEERTAEPIKRAIDGVMPYIEKIEKKAREYYGKEYLKETLFHRGVINTIKEMI